MIGHLFLNGNLTVLKLLSVFGLASYYFFPFYPNNHSEEKQVDSGGLASFLYGFSSSLESWFIRFKEVSPFKKNL